MKIGSFFTSMVKRLDLRSGPCLSLRWSPLQVFFFWPAVGMWIAWWSWCTLMHHDANLNICMALAKPSMGECGKNKKTWWSERLIFRIKMRWDISGIVRYMWIYAHIYAQCQTHLYRLFSGLWTSSIPPPSAACNSTRGSLVLSTLFSAETWADETLARLDTCKAWK